MATSCTAWSKCNLIVIKVKVDKTKERFINVNQVTTQSTNLKTICINDFESLAVLEAL